MTPAAHHAAAIEILETIFDGQATEKALINWTRGHRFAGSKDRAAIRDIVFDCVRRKRSYQAMAGHQGARACVIGSVIASDKGVEGVFSGEGYAPSPLTDQEQAAINPDISNMSDPVRLDYPDWLDQVFDGVLADAKSSVLQTLQSRGPVSVRVNTSKTDRKTAQDILRDEGLDTIQGECPTSLIVTHNPHRLSNTNAYQEGLVELQDIGAQEICLLMSEYSNGVVLDYCAGGGGKSLALAARSKAEFYAYDFDQNRMKDIPHRALRAYAKINILDRDPVDGEQKFDLVVLDVPCSGSGTWRRNPDAKWRFDPETLTDLVKVQSKILDETSQLVSPGGRIAYITCSLFTKENQEIVESFLAKNMSYKLVFQQSWLPDASQDGFFYALLVKT